MAAGLRPALKPEPILLYSHTLFAFVRYRLAHLNQPRPEKGHQAHAPAHRRLDAGGRTAEAGARSPALGTA